MKKIIMFIGTTAFILSARAQTVQTGIGTKTVAKGVSLQLESTNKGFLIPRVSLASRTNQTPLVGTISTGTLIFNIRTFGNFPDEVFLGYYYWDQEETQWKPLAENDHEVSAKFFNNSTSTRFYDGSNVVKMDLLGTTYYNENPDIIKKNNSTDLEIAATGLYEITANLGFKKNGGQNNAIGVAITFRLNGNPVGTTHYIRVNGSSSAVESPNSASFTEFIEITEGQILTITSQKATTENVVDFVFSSNGSSSLEIKRVR